MFILRYRFGCQPSGIKNVEFQNGLLPVDKPNDCLLERARNQKINVAGTNMWEPRLPGGLTVSVTQVSSFPDVASCHTELPLIFFCVAAHVGDGALWRVSV